MLPNHFTLVMRSNLGIWNNSIGRIDLGWGAAPREPTATFGHFGGRLRQAQTIFPNGAELWSVRAWPSRQAVSSRARTPGHVGFPFWTYWERAHLGAELAARWVCRLALPPHLSPTATNAVGHYGFIASGFQNSFE